jgi:hypothetical protein
MTTALIPKEHVRELLDQANHRLMGIDLAWGDAK